MDMLWDTSFEISLLAKHLQNTPAVYHGVSYDPGISFTLIWMAPRHSQHIKLLSI